MTRDEWFDVTALAGLAVIIWLIIMLTALAREEHKQTRKHVEGVAEAHKDEVQELKKLRLNVFRHFTEWLRIVTGRSKDDEPPAG